MRRRLTAILSLLLMAVLILDTKTMLQGAADGIRLCINTLIPSLFPFILLSSLLASSLLGMRLPFSKMLSKLLRVSPGSASIFAVGLLGGYPVGAQCICQATEEGALSSADARRMICFCSNAGPSFIFGIGAALFEKTWLCWIIWLIHILSAMIVGMLTPGKTSEGASMSATSPLTLPKAMKKALVNMGMICGWVIVFRIFITLLDKWIFWLFPDLVSYILCGLLELANGCFALAEVESESIRFIIFSALLAFGGLCVTMQTYAVTAPADLDTARYLPGKITQAAISVTLSSIVSIFLFPGNDRLKPSWFFLCAVIVLSYPLIVGRHQIQKNTGISEAVRV